MLWMDQQNVERECLQVKKEFNNEKARHSRLPEILSSSFTSCSSLQVVMGRGDKWLMDWDIIDDQKWTFIVVQPRKFVEVA